MNPHCYPAFFTTFTIFFKPFFVSIDFIRIKQVVHIAHIQYSTSSSEKLFDTIEKTACLSHAVIVFLLYTDMKSASFDPNYAAGGNFPGIQLRKRHTHGALRSAMREHDQLHISILITFALLHHRRNAHAMTGKRSCNLSEDARLILGAHTHKMHAGPIPGHIAGFIPHSRHQVLFRASSLDQI